MASRSVNARAAPRARLQSAETSGPGTATFALFQVLGVAAFAGVASQAGRLTRALGARGAVQLGAVLQMLACGALLLASRIGVLSFVEVAPFWCVFCGALAVRGPSAFSEALALPPAQIGRRRPCSCSGFCSRERW
jgi:MFS transporter, DHA1 family, multidrug resistance protein